jgi:DNA invertase Pin-like site-specific DNA recombinase
VKAAALYARISSDREGTEAGVRRQIEESRAWADRHGVTIAEVYVDNDISAYRGKPRPDYRRMCEDVKAGTRDGVIAWHLDRLHRNPIELEEFIILIEATGIEVRTVTGGDYDLSTSDGRAMARVVGAFARKESEDKSRRMKSERRQRANAGKRSWGGTRAFGYSADHRKLIPKEAAIVKEAAKRILAGETLRSVCVDLNNRRVPTVTGKQWTTTVLRGILNSGSISGQVEHLGQIVATGDWPAIITPSETTRLRTKFSNPARRTNRTPRRYPLTGLLRCGLCGAKMVARPREDGVRRYVCAKGPGLSGCGRMAILSESLEKFVTEAILHRLDTPDLQRALVQQVTQDDEAEALQRQIDEARADLEALATVHGEGHITLAEWLAARKPIEARIQNATRHLSRLTKTTALEGFVGNSKALQGQWTSLSPARQRAIVAALIDHLTIAPALKGRNTFDPNRIGVLWRA